MCVTVQPIKDWVAANSPESAVIPFSVRYCLCHRSVFVPLTCRILSLPVAALVQVAFEQKVMEAEKEGEEAKKKFLAVSACLLA